MDDGAIETGVFSVGIDASGMRAWATAQNPSRAPDGGASEAMRESTRSAGDLALERVGQRLAEARDQGAIRART